MPMPSLVGYLRNESPQAVAVILGRLPPQHAALIMGRRLNHSPRRSR